MTAFMQSNGTISRWSDNNNRDIFFPEQTVGSDGEVKLRGGAPTYCPRFDPKTNDEQYVGIDVPHNQHCDAIPFSLGFNPYFATNGKPFVIRNGPELLEGTWHGGEKWKKEDLDLTGSFIGLKLVSQRCLLELDYGTVQICVIDGYNNFCIWSDRPDLYICVGPVLHSAGSMPLMLRPGQSQRSECALHYKPKAA